MESRPSSARVMVCDIAEDGPHSFIVTEYIAGTEVQKRIVQAPGMRGG